MSAIIKKDIAQLLYSGRQFLSFNIKWRSIVSVLPHLIIQNILFHVIFIIYISPKKFWPEPLSNLPEKYRKRHETTEGLINRSIETPCLEVQTNYRVDSTN
jgi:hypothetical protein